MLSNSSIDPEEFFDNLRYSINLMWINSQKDDLGEYVFPGKDIIYILNQLKKWHISNPKAEVNFWYDSECTNTNAIENTQELLEKISVTPDSSIKLRNIREIPFVKNNSDLFLPGIPIYFRVDFLKLILSAHLMEHKTLSFVIYTDLSICDKKEKALTKQELFNPIVLKDLEELGILLGEDAIKVENQFLQMMNTPELLNSLKHAINSCLLLATNQLNLAIQQNNSAYLSHLYYSPFDATMGHISVYYQSIKRNNPIKIRCDVVNEGNENNWVNYNPDKHGYIMFGNRMKTHVNGSVYYDKKNDKIFAIHKIIKLPDDLNFFASLEQSANRNDLHPGHVGGSHGWHGELPRPMQGDEFHCIFWPLNSVLSHEIEDIATTEGTYEVSNAAIAQNQPQKYKGTLWNKGAGGLISETHGEDKQDKINVSGPGVC